ncbi:MAG: hypothetical protein WAV08_13465, partial [Desulfobacterales bacterium]
FTGAAGFFEAKNGACHKIPYRCDAGGEGSNFRWTNRAGCPMMVSYTPPRPLAAPDDNLFLGFGA